MALELRDVLELAREFRCRRVKVGDIEVELSPEERVPDGFGADPRTRLPTELEIRDEASIAGLPLVPREYQRAFGGRAPRFEDLVKLAERK